jgi:hypothetical protein
MTQTQETTLATLNQVELSVPHAMSEFLDDKGNLLQAKAYIQKKAGQPINRKVKITDLIKSLGDKGKAMKKAYNAARPIIAKAHAKAWALAGADPTMRKSIKFVYNTKGTFIGVNGSARFVKTSVDTEALVEANAALLAKIAQLEAAALPATA